MYQLKDAEVDFIEQKIRGSGEVIPALFQDLLDHFCCFVENEMAEGEGFDAAFQKAYLAITPNGVDEIQEELFFTLHFNKQITMKRILYFSGFLATFGISIGLLLRSMRWDAIARVFFFCGFGSLIIVVGILLFQAFRNAGQPKKSYIFRLLSGSVAGFFIAMGSLFKLMYAPGANIMTVLGMAIFAFVFLPSFFLKLYHEAIERG